MRMPGGSRPRAPCARRRATTPASVTSGGRQRVGDVVPPGDGKAHPRRVAPTRSVNWLPSRPPSATSSARTSPSVPKRTTGPGKSAAAATTSGSSAFTTAVADGRSRRNSSASASAAPCSDPTPSRCSGATHVMTPASGCAISASRHSPGPFMPELDDGDALRFLEPEQRERQATRLFCVPRVCSTASARTPGGGSPPAISLVVVLPLLPTTASTRARRRRRWRQIAERGEALAHHHHAARERLIHGFPLRQDRRPPRVAPPRRDTGGHPRSRRGWRRKARRAQGAVSVVIPVSARSPRRASSPHVAASTSSGQKGVWLPVAALDSLIAGAQGAPHLLAVVQVPLLGADDLVVLVALRPPPRVTRP